MYDGHSEPK
jgi:hypothetical protein